MSQSIPNRYNVVALARTRATFDGFVEAERLPRFQALIGGARADVRVTIHFSYSPLGPAQVTGQLKSGVPQVCQRCLQPMRCDVAQHFHIVLTDSDAVERRLPEDQDWLRIDDSGLIDLPDLIEDELILALPQHPMHPEGECFGAVADALEALTSETKQVQSRRPFSGLSDLLKTKPSPES